MLYHDFNHTFSQREDFSQLQLSNPLRATCRNAMDASIEGFVKALGGGVGAVSWPFVVFWA